MIKQSIQSYHLLKENKGKPYAVNYGVKLAKEEYTIIADSDDAFYSNTFNKLKEVWESISDKSIAAIWSLVEDENQNIKGDKFPENPWIVNFKERVLNRNKQIQGDKWHCWRTNILKQFPLFYDEECHIGESHTWNAINSKYNFYCINMVFLKVYNSEVSLMNSKKPKKIIARAAYLSSYYGLKDVSIKDMLKYKYYRYLAFMYIKSLPNYSSKKLKLSLNKILVASLIFLYSLPNKVIHKLS